MDYTPDPVKPFVAIFAERGDDRQVLSRGRTCIVLGRGSKYIYTVALLDGWGYRIHKVSFGQFEEDFRQLFTYIDGKPDPTQPYDLVSAARRFLEAGQARSGITPAAEQMLTNLINGKGLKMENVDQATAAQEGSATDAATTATKAKKRTPAAPKKEKAKKEAKPAVKKESAKKSKKEAKPAAKKEPKKVSKKDAKPAAKKAAADSRAGRPTTSDAEKIISVRAEGNPRREGTQVFENFKLVRRYDGKSIAKYLEAGGRLDMIRDDIVRKYVVLKNA